MEDARRDGEKINNAIAQERVARRTKDGICVYRENYGLEEQSREGDKSRCGLGAFELKTPLWHSSSRGNNAIKGRRALEPYHILLALECSP